MVRPAGGVYLFEWVKIANAIRIERMFFKVGLLFMAMLTMAHAKILTFSDTIPPRTLDWEDTLTFSKFPPGLGILTGIDIEINASIDGSLAVENLYDSASTISSTTDVNIQLTRPDGSELAASVATQTNADAFHVFDGSPDLQGISAKTYPLSAQKNETLSLTNLSESDRNLFTGTDTIPLSVIAKGTTGFVSVGHVLTEFNIAASAAITVTYTYTESDLTVRLIPQGALRIGNPFTYLLLVNNIGPDASLGPITITDILPPTFILQSIQGADWTCSSNNQANTCTHSGPLPTATSLPVLSVTVFISPSSPPTLSKTSSVYVPGDINPDNDTLTTGLLIAGTSSEGYYEPPSYQFPSTPQTGYNIQETTYSGEQKTETSNQSSPQAPFSFGQEHGAFGGPTRPTTGAILIVDAEGCPVSAAYLSPQKVSSPCSTFDPSSIPPGPYSRQDVLKIALSAHCIPIKGNIIQTAQTHGIVTDDPRPDDQITNAEMLAIILRASNALPRGYSLHTPLNWVAPYLHFARLHHLITPDFYPQGFPTSDDVLDLLQRTQFLNPNPNVNRRPFFPVRLVGGFQPSDDTTCEERDPHIVSCLAEDNERELTFSDISPLDPAFKAIELLRRTRIAPMGDYIFSGHGNHSTGIQQTNLQKGSFEFQPLRPATRLEVVKIALISNCIHILDYIPGGTQTFTDIHKGFLNNDVHDFTARVFYTAALHGIIKGYPDGSARPHASADHLEAMAILLRAAGAIPSGYIPKPPSIPNLPSDGWYAPYISFASESSFLPVSPLTTPIPRNTLSELLTKTMEYSEDIRVRAYMSLVHPLLQ